MLRISKLTDYSTVIMAYLAAHAGHGYTAKEIAGNTSINLPTVSKLLKVLTRAGLLTAQRGSKGGYSLATAANEISLASIIHALEGDTGLTECSHIQGICTMETQCAIRSNWRAINHFIYDTLQNISLADMSKPFATRLSEQALRISARIP
jgi:FeS assembly SUF system regulator